MAQVDWSHFDLNVGDTYTYSDSHTPLSSDAHAESTKKNFDATQLYLGEIGSAKLLTAEEEVELALNAKKGCVRSRNKMVESNLRLVVKIARRYLNRGLDLLDLIEEGNLGLMHAISKFDPTKGFRFSTYGTWWIRQTIERALMNQTRTIRLPIHIVKELNIYLRAERELEQKLDHPPRTDEIADYLGKPVKDVEKMFCLKERVSSMDGPINEDNEKSFINWKSPFLGHNIEGEYPVDALLKELKENKMVGVANGRAEFGPRALGNRSLLADPRGEEIKDLVNAIKKRQKFRPFAPAILEEDVNDYFDLPTGVKNTPYMQYTAAYTHGKDCPAILHHDGTSRVQTVSKSDNEGFYELLKAWKKETGCPILLNTSLNIKGMPMVNDTKDGKDWTNKYGVKVL